MNIGLKRMYYFLIKKQFQSFETRQSQQDHRMMGCSLGAVAVAKTTV